VTIASQLGTTSPTSAVGAALGDLLAPLAAAGTVCTLEVRERAALGPADVSLVSGVLRATLRRPGPSAPADRVHVSMESRPLEGRAGIRLVVAGDGAGLDGGGAYGGLGIAGLARLAAGAGGRVTIRSRSGRGTVVELVAPTNAWS